MLSVQEAADEVGVNKTTIWRAVKSGKLSATQDGDGQYQIDPAELARVYPPGARNADDSDAMQQHATAENSSNDIALQVELAVLRERVQALERERDSLADDKAAAKAERDRLYGMVEATQRLLPGPEAKPAPAEGRPGLLGRLFGRG